MKVWTIRLHEPIKKIILFFDAVWVQQYLVGRLIRKLVRMLPLHPPCILWLSKYAGRVQRQQIIIHIHVFIFIYYNVMWSQFAKHPIMEVFDQPPNNIHRRNQIHSACYRVIDSFDSRSLFQQQPNNFIASQLPPSFILNHNTGGAEMVQVLNRFNTIFNDRIHGK